ncbi:MAG: YggS family pyridoxal phosphate-dependent enzyme [Bacteroides sp.]|nr:YggS family pyridoxal phosphate-dependent enzyme [Bacteroides sp.]
MSHIQKEIQAIKSGLPEGVHLVAVSKFHPIESLQEAYDGGQRIFGESKVQEMTQKYEALPKDIEWHFIGHLQTNKIKYMAPYVALIHGVDSYKLLAEINKQASKVGRIIPCLLQIHIAQEETKFGFTPDECLAMLEEGSWRSLTHVQIAGVMGMGTNTDDLAQVETEFATLSALFRQMKETYFTDAPYFKEISMGMSDDYLIAIRQGSTLIRIGSRIFGERNY